MIVRSQHSKASIDYQNHLFLVGLAIIICLVGQELEVKEACPISCVFMCLSSNLFETDTQVHLFFGQCSL